MEKIIYRSETRGKASYGWLNTRYSFSFANYYDPQRIHFGALRVLNDDEIAGGTGFDLHPHDNMEIVTLVLEGELRHTDSMKNTEIIKPNEVQVMSAGTGIFHAEHNNLPGKTLKLFQVWVFPNEKNITPRYDQRFFDPAQRKNKWQVLVGPEKGESLMIHQQAWFNRVDLFAGNKILYKTHGTNQGIFLFMISGEVCVGDDVLKERDAMGMWDTSEININSEKDAELLLIEVPMF
ncbi:MAG: pirin family protein [Bacteroidales bacterium]